MTESEGPDNSGRAAAGPGKKKRRRVLDRVRPYAVGTVVMAVVFGGAALIGAHVRATKEDKFKEPSGAVAAAPVPGRPGSSPSPGPGGPKLAVPVHPSVPVTVTIYQDLRSPDSKAFDEEYRATLGRLLATGQVQLNYRLVTASDQAYGGTGAKVAANAAACAQDQGRYSAFVQQVWSHQPDPQSDALARLSLMKQLARKAGKIKMGTFEPCLEQGDHDGWVQRSQSDFAARHLGGVPAVQINGVTVHTVHTTLTPARLRTMVISEASRVIAAQSSPTVTPAALG